MNGDYVEHFEYAIDNTPCALVVEERRLVHIPDRILELFPHDPELKPDFVSYLGAPLLDADGSVLGHLAALDTKPMPAEGPHPEALFRIFAARAAAEVQRLRAEERAREFHAQAAYLAQEIASLHQELLGESRAMQRLRGEIAEVAPTGATALVFGETGTGKELVARAIHAASRRAGKPLVKVNCAAMPAALIESELFGHERGAFTGAAQRRQGRFALADGGAIFLDEIGELPLELQPKLLRVLQEGEFEPLGSSRTHKVDVRVIAATNRDLPREVAAGRFREDLFYRLNVFPLRVPALRERGDDVRLLAESFARRFAHKTGKPVNLPLPPGAVRQLRSYDWPGNVRELQNAVERAVITSSGGILRFNLPTASAPRPASNPSLEILTAEEMRRLERVNLIRALEQTGWKVSGPDGAGALLGIPPTTLQSRMKALGITKNRQ
jgi:transcriptional regulator with GAF, ATPase, and Fis domain